MRTLHRSDPSLPSPSFALLILLFAVLWLAGGASRPDVPGQAVVRGAAAGAIILALLFGPRPLWDRTKPAAILLLLGFVLAIVQLIPLPPAIWEALPGRSMLSGATEVIQHNPVWRPLSISPSMTMNAGMSLIVPAAVVLLLSGLREKEWALLPGLLLGAIGASMLVGLLQFSGTGIDNPLVNDKPGMTSGLFANRNHFALFMALGCLLVPAWVFGERQRPAWRGPVGLGLILLFALTALGSGSRAGMGLTAVALAIALVLSWRRLKADLRRRPRWVVPALIAGMAALVSTVILLSVASGRAVSIDRLMAEDAAQDMRARALPTIWQMIQGYFPAGLGLGTFDSAFRMDEPFGLLKPTYLNHAHNDFLEIVLDAGLAGALLLLAALGWWAWASVRAWRGTSQQMLPRLGSAILFLVIVASLFDYPARTPTIMAVMVVAAAWLASKGGSAGALRDENQSL